MWLIHWFSHGLSSAHHPRTHHVISCEYTFLISRPNRGKTLQDKRKEKDSNSLQLCKNSKCCYNAANMLYKCAWTRVLQHLKLRNMGGGSICNRFDKRERALISCAGRDPALPCTVPQGYCRALTILLPIFTSSVLPTTANGKWLCGTRKNMCVGILTYFLFHSSLRGYEVLATMAT